MSTDPFGLVGQVLDGQFRVDELVGEGGFSAVYRGHHIGLNEPIAIKSLKLPVALQTSLVDTFVQRFRDESRLLYRLSQGNLHIVRSIAAGTTTSSTGVLVPFMVLEWLNGRSLAADFGVRRDLGKTGRTLPEIAQAFATAADALSYAHAQGVVHRDLNPGNFFLATTPNLGIKMKVLDFGVAKVMHDSTLGLGPRAQTVGQFRIFAPAYGAPEQFDDTIGTVSSASDVYSFALVLLEAMRDQPVNEGVNLADFARFAIDPNRRPTPRLLGMDVADEIEAVFARATQLDPKKRWQTVAELWGALTSAITSAGEKRPAPKPAPQPSVQKTLPLGASSPFPRPAPRPAAGSPAAATPPPAAGFSGAKPAANSSVAKSTQRFGGNMSPPPPTSAPASGAVTARDAKGPASSPEMRTSSPGDATARPTSRPGPLGASTNVSTKPPSSKPTSGRPKEEDDEEGDEPTKVAATDPRILKMAAAAPGSSRESLTSETRVRDSETGKLPSTRLGPPLRKFDPGDDDPTTATEKPPSPRRPASMPPIPAAGRPAFGDTIAMASPVAPEAGDDDDRAPDSGGTLIMAPGQTLGQPLNAPPSSGSLQAAALGAAPMNAPLTGLASTLAFTPGPGQASMSGSWPNVQGGPPPGQHQGPPGDPAFYPGQSQVYPPQQGYPPPGGNPMYPAHNQGMGGPMHSPSMPAGVPQAPPSFAFPPPEPPAEPAKKPPVVLLAAVGALVVLALGGTAVFLTRSGHEREPESPIASPSDSAAPADSAPPEAPPPPTPPPVATAATTTTDEVEDAGVAAPAETVATPAEDPPPAPTATNTAPTYTWPPPANTGAAPANTGGGTSSTPVNNGGGTTPTPANTGVVPVPVNVTTKDAGGAATDPNAFNESMARARLTQANGILSACTFDGSVTGPGKALVTFASDGTVASVALDAPFVGTKQGDCAVRQFQRAKVSPFSGGPRTVKHSFEIPK